MVEWVEKYENIDRHFCFFEAYAWFSPLYQQVGMRLLSMKTVGSMDVEPMTKQFKHVILTWLILCGTVFYGIGPNTVFVVYTSKVP